MSKYGKFFENVSIKSVEQWLREDCEHGDRLTVLRAGDNHEPEFHVDVVALRNEKTGVTFIADCRVKNEVDRAVDRLEIEANSLVGAKK